MASLFLLPSIVSSIVLLAVAEQMAKTLDREVVATVSSNVKFELKRASPDSDVKLCLSFLFTHEYARLFAKET